MKKEVIVLLVFFVLLTSFVSASWWDKITGKATTNDCTDSDGGLNYYVKGYAEGRLFLDSDEIGIREDKCAKKRFESGEFVGWNYIENCEENCGISEAFCHESSGKITASSLEFECPGKCRDGACVQEINRSCVDSDETLSGELDSGLNYYKKGSVTLWENGQIIETEIDYCTDGKLTEFVCDDNNIESGTYNCPSGCEGGKCIEPSSGCIDSDNGDNIYKKGYRMDLDKNYIDYGKKKYDYCIEDPIISDDGNITADEEKKANSCEGKNCYIIEYHCREDLSNTHKGFPCPAGCEDGVCTESEFFYDNCEYFLQNGEFNEKLDIFFLPFNVTNEFFNELIEKMIYSDGRPVSNECGDVEARGLLKVEPFKSNQDRINVEFSGKLLDFNYFECSYVEGTGFYSKPYLYCNWNKLKQNIPFDPDIIVVIGKDFRTVADKNVILFGDLASADPTTPINHGFVHEMGHAFGGLTDEYTYSFTYNCEEEDCYYISSPDSCVNSEDPNCFPGVEKEINIIPNEDIVGCPKWCESYDKEKLKEISLECTQIDNMKDCLVSGCLWFKQKHPWFDSNCIPRKTWEDIGISCTSQCILGQHYGHISFTPDCTEGGMMSNTIGDFNPVSREHLEMALNCCFPKSSSQKCKEFSEKFTLTEEQNPYFKFAYDKFANCYSEKVEEKKEDNLTKDCIGCLLDNKCYPFNYRKEGKYCSIDQEFVSQLESGSSCENNFECSSNLCIDDECVSVGLFQKIINWFKKLFGGK